MKVCHSDLLQGEGDKIYYDPSGCHIGPLTVFVPRLHFVRMGCHGPRTEHGKCRNSDPFWHDMGLLQQVTLIPGVFTGLEDFFLDLQ